MDMYWWIAIGSVAGGIGTWVTYRMWGRWEDYGTAALALLAAYRETVNALAKFDDMADKHYGEGSIPDHIKQIRDDLEKIHGKLLE